MHVHVLRRQRTHFCGWFDILQSAVKRDHFLYNGRRYHWCASLSDSLNITVGHVISSLQAQLVAAGPEIWSREKHGA